MVNSKHNSVQLPRFSRIPQGTAHRCSALLRAPRLHPSQGLVLMGSLGIMASGVAIADESGLEVAEPEPMAESPVKTPDVEVTPSPQISLPHVSTSAGSAVTLTAPAKPQFAPSPTLPIAKTSPPHLSQPMQPPVPPPAAAAIVIPA